jgi:uncharacterized protein YfaS (alpha-2-macroglobulin family)
VSWQPPAWLRRANDAARRAAVSVRERPRQSALVAASVIAIVAAAAFAWRWYESRPKPAEISFTVIPPAPTCYSCTPPVDPYPLLIQFESSVAPIDRIGRALDDQDGVRLKPALPGEWTWDDDKQLRFQPRSDWPIGARFTVELSRKRAIAEHVRLKRYEIEFDTPAFAAQVAGTEFHQDPVVASNKKVVANIGFTHPVDPESFEKRVRLRMFDKVTDTQEKELKAPGHTVVYDKLKLNAYIHSAQLEVPPKARRLEIVIEPGVRASRGGNATASALKASVEVPGLNSLKIASTSLDLVRDERNEPNQVLLVQTSFSVKESDLPERLSAWLLPEKHPDPKVQADFEARYVGTPTFHWNQQNVTPDILRASQRLELTQIPGEREHYELHSFRYAADPGRYLYVKIDAGLKSFGGYVLGESVERILPVPEFPREIGIMHEGSLLSLSGERTVSLFARNIPAIRVEVGRLLPRQLQHLVSQNYGTFSRPEFGGVLDAANITERFEKIIRLPTSQPGKAQYEALDLSEYLDARDSDRRGVFLLRVQAWDANRNQPLEYVGEDWNSSVNGRLSDARVIVVTDLGLLVKRSIDGSQDVFVQSIASGAPVPDATVEVLGRNGLPVMTETTDSQGHVRFPDLRSFQRERQPTLYLVRRGGDSSFLPYSQYERTLDLSRFDVGGVYSNADRGALAAYLFSDRGIYRPGEEIRAAAIIRSQDWRQRFAGVPLRLEITDPRGTVIRRENFVPGPGGFGEIRHETKHTSPTGIYTLAISVVRDARRSDLIGSTTVQVRDFQPDRLRMRATFSATSADGWVSPDNLTAQIQLENLFGTPAEDRRVAARMTLSPSIPSFRAYPDYRFHDPQYAKEGFSEQLADVKTDAQGRATLALNLQRFARATYRVHLVAQGFEADGGRGVTTEAAQLVSSMPFLIGYKPDGALDYIARDSDRSVDLIAIDPRAQRTAVDGLKLARLESRFVSVLMRQPNGTYKYESRRKDTALEETALSLPASGFALKLDTRTPGNFAYVIKDAQDQVLMRIDYQVAGDANISRTLEKNAELQLTLAKSDYAPGEDIELSIRAPYSGAGLITIERERVYAWRWFKSDTTSSVQRIKVPAGLEGNAYVSVTFVRDPGSSEIYTSPLSYGVQPFSIDVSARRNAVSVEAPALAKPGQPLTLRYRTETPSRIVVFAVDEGILQVAQYRSPDPLKHFFQKRALEVTTTQILDLILPEFRHLGLSAAPGGDAEGALGRHLNPFRRKGEKPVAFWSGILDADGTPRELSYDVPDYFNGTLRVMAVAVSDDRIGIHDGRTVIRGDFVLSPNAPTTVTPGDEFDVSLGISNNVEGSGPDAKVTVALEADDSLEIVGEASQQIAIAEGRESSVRFRLKARDVPGAAAMKFTARTGDGRGTRSIDLSIRPATPYMTQLRAGVVERGSQDVRITRQLYPHYRKLEAGVSTLPLQLAHGFVSYLSNYPYACTEQIVSQAMPAVLLASRPEFGYVRTQPGADIVALLSELRARQDDAGAYKVWPGSSEVNEFVSLYAQHLLLEAAERDHGIPPDMLTSGNEYVRSIAARDGDNLTDERNTAYAIYLLTRQGQRMSAEVAAQRKRLAERYANKWEQDLTAAWLAAALDLMKQDSDAEQLIRALRFSIDTGDELYYDSMTRDALLLFVLARHFPERLRDLPADVMTTMARRISEGFYHSLSSGTTLLALDAYASATGEQTGRLSIAEVLAQGRVRALSLPSATFPKAPFTEQATALRFSNESDVRAFYLIDESGFDRTLPDQAIKQGLEVIREYVDAQGRPVTQIGMGDEITVRLKFRALGGRWISSIALVDLLPGGFELVVPSESAATPFIEASAEDEESYSSAYDGWRCQVCAQGSTARLSYADMREDRVVFYAAASNDVQQVVYKIKATNAGAYVTPPAYGEAMYDRSVIARSTAGRLAVTRP